jgi:hypothetical protein
MNRTSPYAGSCIVLTTKHAKSIAVAPPLRDRLAVGLLEFAQDTDLLGTFTGEVEREGTAFDCAKRKCETSLDTLGADYVLASEGSFGPHPLLPFLPCDHEVLHFVDRKRGFDLSVSHLSENTNYRMQSVGTLEELERFAVEAKFPSHALIVRPNDRMDNTVLIKGIDTREGLETAFLESRRHSGDGKVWVQTDMRAHRNPSRMAVIGEAAEKLAQRLATTCPACGTPGWGSLRTEVGLPCEYCAEPTEMVVRTIFGCVLCAHTEAMPRPDGLLAAPQGQCGFCNP